MPAAVFLQVQNAPSRANQGWQFAEFFFIGGGIMSDAVSLGTATPVPDSEPGRPTLKTVAADTGLAVATVSRALNDAPDIGEETKRRVREAAKRLGYRPNRAGVRLRTGKTNVLALVLSTEAEMMNHTSRLIYSIANALRGTAYHLVVMPYFPDQDPMDPVRYIVETGSADGVILNQTRAEDPRITYLTDRGFPFATHGRTGMGLSHVYYDFDNEAYARLAVRALCARKRQRLLLIAPPREHMYSRHTVLGFAEAAAEHGATFEIAESVTSDDGAEVVESFITERMSAPNPPDGLVMSSTSAAMAAVAASELLGLVLGRDFDLVAKEAIPMLRRFRRNLLIIPETVGKAGDFLARGLIAGIENPDAPPAQGLEVPDTVELPPDAG